MPLDMPTLFLVVTVVAFVMAGWVGVMAWGQRRSEALWSWAAVMCAFAVSNVLYGFRGVIGDFWSVVLGNGVLSLAFALMLLSLWRFQGIRPRPLLMGLPVLLALGLYALFIDAYRIRVIVGGTLFPAQLGLVLQVLLSRRRPVLGRGRWMLVTGAAVLGAILLLRALGMLLGWLDAGDALANYRWQAMLVLVAMVAVLSFGLGFVYMNLERAERRSFELAMRDVLTGLANRRAILDLLRSSVARARRQGQWLSVLMVDIDHFKAVNDNHGHQAGDAVLRQVAQTLASRLRAQDQIGRFGGEEFLVLLPDTQAEGARVLADALRQAVQQTSTPWGGRQIAVTISVGVCGHPLSEADSPESLIAAADRAMYQAKCLGRNRVEQVGEESEAG